MNKMLSGPLNVLINVLLFCFLLLSITVIFVEKLWIPISERWKARRDQRRKVQDTSQFDEQRSTVIQEEQKKIEKSAIKKQREREELARTKRDWIVREKEARLGISTSSGARLGRLNDGKEVKEKESISDPYAEERLLREIQDLEFEESLRKDQKKEERARRRKEAQQRKKEVMLEQAKRLEHDYPIPPKGEAACHVMVRLPSGERVERKFSPQVKLEAVLCFVESMTGLERYQVQLVSPMPRQVFQDLDQTLQEAGLAKKAVLIAEEA